ncbi:MAG: hypothetical protein ACOX3Q_12280 [Clostridia bacterium]|jgi:hypothetical protein
MEKLFDLLLERVNDEAKQAAGLVSIMDSGQSARYIKVRIWDLTEGVYVFHIGNSSSEYKAVTQFRFVKPYINFEFPTDMQDPDRVLVTDEKNAIVLLSDSAKNDRTEVLHPKNEINDGVFQGEDVPISDGMPRPPKLSEYWNLSDKEEEEKPKEGQEESLDTFQAPAFSPEEGVPDMVELPDYLLDSDPEKVFRSRKDFDIESYRKAMERQFDSIDPFSNRRDDYEWWRVENPVVLHEILLDFGVKIRNFFNARVMISFFKYGFLLSGIYRDGEEGSLLVFGFPSPFRSEQEPFENYSVWVRNRGNQNGPEGYWLVYYDPNQNRMIVW